MIEKELEEKEKYDKLYKKLSHLHGEIHSWASSLGIIATKLCGDYNLLGMYDLGVIQQKIRHRQEEIEQNWLEEDEEDGQED